MLVDQALQADLHVLLHSSCMADEITIQELSQRRQGRCQTHRMAVVGRADRERVLAEVIGEVVAHADASERDRGSVDALGERDNVRHDRRRMAEAEQLAATTEASHDLVAHHQDAVLVADLANGLEIAAWRLQHAIGAGDALHEDGGNVLGTFVGNLTIERWAMTRS